MTISGLQENDPEQHMASTLEGIKKVPGTLMVKLLRPKLVCVVTMAILLVLIFLIPQLTYSPRYRVRQENKNIQRYLIYSPKTCVLPEMDPYEPSIRQYIKIRKHVKCPQWNFVTYLERKRIVINETAVGKFYSNFTHCSYRPYRKRLNKDNGMDFLNNKFKNFTKFVDVTDEFCFVICYSKTEAIITKQTYAVVLRNETLVKARKSKLLNRENGNMPMSVLFLVLESTSRLSAIRHLNVTRDFLMDKLQAVEIQGYNKIGLNTLPNMIPIMLGKPITELNDTRHFFDHYPFIWKDFENSGYLTHMGQDGTKISAFHYLCSGFKRAPVDYYIRPYLSALESINRHGLCSGNTLVIQSMMHNLKEFAMTYKDMPYFSFMLYGEPSHDDPNGLGVLDLPLYHLLNDMKKQSLLENTIIIMAGDHGSRYGPIRKSFQGRMEENLPALYIAVPKWFRQKHVELYENLKENANKLTSNVDIYATFHDIMELGKGQKTPTLSGKYGTSLLRNISRKRTCEDLKIPQHYCMCSEFVTDSTHANLVNRTAHWVVGKINEILINVSDLCEIMALNKVDNAWTSNKTSHGLEKIDIIIQFSVLPSNATFDAHIRYDPYTDNIALLGHISRTNKYSGQSDCVAGRKNGISLERFCYCKSGKKLTNTLYGLVLERSKHLTIL